MVQKREREQREKIVAERGFTQALPYWTSREGFSFMWIGSGRFVMGQG